MKLIPRLRRALQRWMAWRHEPKSLRQMPLPYLVFMTAISSFAFMIGAPMLTRTTETLIDKLLPAAPWYITAILGLYLVLWWSIVGTLALVATSHGRALGDRLFNTPNASA